ncbi:hypothetical protein [Paenibacillus sp. 481]|uniref:hypothetical protein n=1 Tax=Paenibacillus sp. 481 TaxID=2835869 RepID=UPI001E537E23|nr:hypothetical protein [Paenibacillus sp. 481]UHA72176.1 hypothetical protein KIK04_15905 [Paenibacillus sp. 481]
MYDQTNRSTWIKGKQRACLMLLLVTLCVLSGCMPSWLLGTSTANRAPTNTNKNITTTDMSSPIHYDIDATLDERAHTIHATATITFRNVFGRSLSELLFHWNVDSYRFLNEQPTMYKAVNERLRVTLETDGNKGAAQVDNFVGGATTHQVVVGKQLAEFEHKRQMLNIQLPKKLAPNETIQLTIKYEVSVPYGAQRLSYMKDYVGGTYWTPQLAVYNSIEGVWNQAPVYTSYNSDFFYAADYTVKLDMPANWTVVTSGQQVSQPAARTTDGERSPEHKQAQPHRQHIYAEARGIRQFVFYASPHWGVTERALQQGGKLIAVGSQPTDDQMNKDIDLAQDAVHFFTQKFGPLPSQTLTFVEAPLREIFDSTDGVIVIGREGGQNPLQPEQRQMRILQLIAKQWFQAAVGSNPHTDAFLAEGLSQFAADYYLFERKNVPWPQRVQRNEGSSGGNSAHGDASGGGSNGLSGNVRKFEAVTTLPITLPLTKARDQAEALYRWKGSLAMAIWAQEVGIESVDRVMQAYYTRYSGRIASVDGFLNVVAQTLDSDHKGRLYHLLNARTPL